jgi:hypothetical protein
MASRFCADTSLTIWLIAGSGAGLTGWATAAIAVQRRNEREKKICKGLGIKKFRLEIYNW